jgi:hypothetical protein
MAVPRAEETITLSNGTVDLEVLVARGPRVVRFGYIGGRNVFAQTPHLYTDTMLGRWHPIGGHRLWVAPERMPGSYAPDERPVSFVMQGPHRADFTGPIDGADMQKSLRIDLDSGGEPLVRITHVVTNRTWWPVRVAPWAISVVEPRGTAVLPQPPFRPQAEHFLPARQLVQWHYTDLTDSRWRVGSKLIQLTPDPSRGLAQKIGAANEAGWCALLMEDVAFVKYAARLPDAEYPDIGSNTEIYCAGPYLELGSLGPLQHLEAGESATHVEHWRLLQLASAEISEDELASRLSAAAQI